MRRHVLWLLVIACTGEVVPDAGPDSGGPDAGRRLDAGRGPDAGREADAGLDGGSIPVLEGCRQSASPIPSEARWTAYFDADVDLGVDGSSVDGRAELAVRAWRSRVGTAVLRPPAGASAPLLELNGWNRRSTCADCLASLRFRTSADRNDVLRDEAGALSPALGSETLTVLVQLEHPSAAGGRLGWSDPDDGTPRWRAGTGSLALSVDGASSSSAPFPLHDPRALALVRELDEHGVAQLHVYEASDGAFREVRSEPDAHFGAVDGRFAIGELAGSETADLRVRRLAISREVFARSDLDAVWSAWRTRDLSLARSAPLAYQNVIAEDGPIAFWRLGAELYPHAYPPGFRRAGAPPLLETLPCSVALSERYEASTDVLTGGFVEAPDSPSYTIPTSERGLSVELWVRFTNLDPTGEPGASGRKDYIHWLGKGERENYEWAFRLYRSDSSTRPSRLSFYAWDLTGGEGPGDYLMHDTEVLRDRWLHVVGVADHPSASGSQLTIYLDGVRGNGGPASFFASEAYGATPGDGSAPVRIGTRTENGYLTGHVADFAIYPRALDDLEVRAHHDAGRAWRDLE